MSYHNFSKPQRKPKPRPKPRVRGPLTPPKPCYIRREDGLLVVWDFENKKISRFVEESEDCETIFPSRLAAKKALWRICEWLKSIGAQDFYEIINYAQ